MTTTYQERHVLYCDILGFSAYSKSEFFEVQRCLQIFEQFDFWLEESRTQIDPSVAVDGADKIPDHIVKPEIAFCSDSLVISTPSTTNDAQWLIMTAAVIQDRLAEFGFSLRGGITTGFLYHSANTIFGPAIVDAVKMENSPCRLPLIRIDPKTIDVLRDVSGAENLEIISIVERRYLSKVDSDMPYVDHFWMTKNSVLQAQIHPQALALIDVWRRHITYGVKSKCKTVFKKYEWLAKRFNAVYAESIVGIEAIQI